MICRNLEGCYETLKTNQMYDECVNKSQKCMVFYDNRSNAKCEENGKSYNLVNSNKYNIALYRIDGGTIVNDQSVPEGVEKCDFLYCINDNGCDHTIILVELKGTDIRKALKQLLGTAMLYKSFLNKFDKAYCRAIVTKATPNIKADPNYVKLFKLATEHNGNVKIVERSFSEPYDSLSKTS